VEEVDVLPQKSLKMICDFVNDFVILDKADNPHPTSTFRAIERINLIDFANHLRSSPKGVSSAIMGG